MHKFSLIVRGDRIPFILVRSQIRRVILPAELGREHVVLPVRENHGAVKVELVDNLHVVLVIASGGDASLDALKLGDAGLDKHDLRGEDALGRVVVKEPVGAGHRHGARGREEQFVHGLENYAVRVEREDSVVLGLVKGQQFCE